MIQRIGERQYAVLVRARRNTTGYVMPGGHQERRACRRLVARGLMMPLVGFPDVWSLTPEGHRCPVVVQ